MKSKIIVILFILCFTNLQAQTKNMSPVLTAMKTELDRSMESFKSQDVPPYFMSYSIKDVQRLYVRASFGNLESSNLSHNRQLDLDVRVGDYSFDNSHEIRGEFDPSQFSYTNIAIPIEDDIDAIRNVLWLETDKRYKKSLEKYTKVKTNRSVKVKEEDASDDFSREQSEIYTEPVNTLKIDRTLWESKLKKYTEPFKSHPKIYEATATFEALIETRYFINTEGTIIQTSSPSVRLMINGFSKADDGMELPRYESFYAFNPEGMPSDADILKKIDKMIQDMENLRVAPVVDPYTGPAILEGGATGVLFHEIFGHRVEGHRQKSEEEGQTFKKMLGEKLLPPSISVIYDPTIDHQGKTDLSGYYKFDDEGVKAQRVMVVENGVLKNFLMGRSPIEKFSKSNGHGRSQAGYHPVSRQSNLFVESSNPVPLSTLRQMLIDDCKKQNKPYGLIFSQIEGGFTMTGRTAPNSFNVLPLVVYKVYTDGRPDELVRGVDLVGTPLTVFSKVAAAGNDPETWYGYCGAESGGVPVSQTCSSILISQVEVQKKSKSQEKPPILSAPSEKNP
jgi:TldD protein